MNRDQVIDALAGALTGVSAASFAVEDPLSGPGGNRRRGRANVILGRDIHDLLGNPGQIGECRRIPRHDLKGPLETASRRDEISRPVGGHPQSGYGVVRG